jgi:4'-phosphopantetheinyl transferase EntD
MRTFRLAKSLSNPKDPEWELLTESTFPGPVHSDRKAGFLLSREALRRCLEARGIAAPPRSLTLAGYDMPAHYSDLTISLSHTATCGAALVADRRTYRAVGVDVEHEERVVKDAIRDRIAHPEDAALRNIELWCLKEAVFKVLMNAGAIDRPVEFSSIRIDAGTWSHPATAVAGEWELERLTPFVVARAWLRS